jgi:hypothetical protein
VGPRDDVEVGVERADALDDQAGLVRIGGRHDDQPGVRDTGDPEHLGVGRVAVDRGHALRSQSVDLVALLRDHHEAEAAPGQRRTDQPAHPAVAADDRVLAERLALLRSKSRQLAGMPRHQRFDDTAPPKPRLQPRKERE